MGYNLREGVNFKQARGTQKGPHTQPARACSNRKSLRKTLFRGFEYGGLILTTERIFPFRNCFQGARYCLDIRFLQSAIMTCFTTSFSLPRPVTISWDQSLVTRHSYSSAGAEGVFPGARYHCRRNWLIGGAAKGSPWSHNRPKSCCCSRFPFKARGCAYHHQSQHRQCFCNRP